MKISGSLIPFACHWIFPRCQLSLYYYYVTGSNPISTLSSPCSNQRPTPFLNLTVSLHPPSFQISGCSPPPSHLRPARPNEHLCSKIVQPLETSVSIMQFLQLPTCCVLWSILAVPLSLFCPVPPAGRGRWPLTLKLDLLEGSPILSGSFSSPQDGTCWVFFILPWAPKPHSVKWLKWLHCDLMLYNNLTELNWIRSPALSAPPQGSRLRDLHPPQLTYQRPSSCSAPKSIYQINPSVLLQFLINHCSIFCHVSLLNYIQ